MRRLDLNDSSSSLDDYSSEILNDCNLWVPPDGDLVRLFFRDGGMAYGLWDGENWRIDEKLVEPEYWQPLARL